MGQCSWCFHNEKRRLRITSPSVQTLAAGLFSILPGSGVGPTWALESLSTEQLQEGEGADLHSHYMDKATEELTGDTGRLGLHAQ